MQESKKVYVDMVVFIDFIETRDKRRYENYLYVVRKLRHVSLGTRRRMRNLIQFLPTPLHCHDRKSEHTLLPFTCQKAFPFFN